MYFIHKDHLHRFDYRQDKQDAAKRLGFRAITEAFVKMYLSGLSLSECGEKMEVTKRQANNNLIRMGIEKRSRGGNNWPRAFKNRSAMTRA